MGPTAALLFLQLLLCTSLAEAAVPLPRPVTLPKPIPTAPVKKPSLGELLDSAEKGIEGLLSEVNPPTTKVTSTRTPTATPVRLTAAWASAPVAAASVAPSCPRAQVYLNYCQDWYGTTWSTDTAAYCLCQGQSKSNANNLVYVPELFDGDAAACASGYDVNAKYYSSMAVAAKDNGNAQLASAYADEYAGATNTVAAWVSAATFCAEHPPAAEGVSSVPPEYYLTANAAAARRGVPATATATPSAVATVGGLS